MSNHNKTDKTAGFNTTMEQARSHMSSAKKHFSVFIHLRLIEILSDVLSASLFRPLPLIFGGVTSLVLPLIIWLVSSNYGYYYSNLETIVWFGIGWAIGVLVDYTKLLIPSSKD